MKIAKRNNSRKRITVVYGKYGLKFSPETPLHIRNLIEDGERDLCEGRTTRRSTEEMIQHVWNLLS